MRLALFDLDGTLIDSEVGIVTSIEYALEKLGVPVPAREVLRGWIGPPLRSTFPRVLGDDSERVERAVELYRERFSAVGWSEHVVYPGIGEVVEGLHAAGVKLAVVTSKASLYAARIVESLPFGACFVHTYAAQPDSSHSEKATMIRQALDDFAIPGGQAVMTGDRRFDIEGAHANGMRGIGVAWGFGSVEELRDAGADAIVTQASELPAQLMPVAGTHTQS